MGPVGRPPLFSRRLESRSERQPPGSTSAIVVTTKSSKNRRNRHSLVLSGIRSGLDPKWFWAAEESEEEDGIVAIDWLPCLCSEENWLKKSWRKTSICYIWFCRTGLIIDRRNKCFLDMVIFVASPPVIESGWKRFQLVKCDCCCVHQVLMADLSRGWVAVRCKSQPCFPPQSVTSHQLNVKNAFFKESWHFVKITSAPPFAVNVSAAGGDLGCNFVQLYKWHGIGTFHPLRQGQYFHAGQAHHGHYPDNHQRGGHHC